MYTTTLLMHNVSVSPVMPLRDGIFEQMKALQDLAGKETAVMIPAPNAVNVPNQIVPEFQFGAFAYVTAITIAIVLVAPIAMKAKPHSFSPKFNSK